ncbi:MAG: biopolymer transporter ExbD [Gammaproteobacteria bacterium]
MNLRPPRREDPDLNMTPLIDVVFLLLIFFMVSTTFDRETELKIQLPEAAGEERQEAKAPIEIVIDAQGRYFVNRQEVLNKKLETLKTALSKVAGDRKDPPLVISADRMTPHEAVIRAMDAASQLGLVHITFVTKQTPDQ